MTRNFELGAIPDMTGKVAIVTGANTGIGRICAQELAKKGAHVFLACRTESKAMPVIEEIKKTSGNEKVEFLALDLLSLKSVKQAADDFKSRNLPLHLLLNNAGVMACPFSTSVDGIESQFATNHVAHFYLTTLLLPVLESSAPSRIVNVSSIGHNFSPSKLKLNELNDEAKYGRWRAYGRSKLSNILFTVELSRRLEERGVKNVYVNSNHPGSINTDLMRHTLEFAKPLLSLFFLSPEDGAVTQMYLATSPEVEEKDIRAKYYIPFAVPKVPSLDARDPELAKELWRFTENLLKEKVSGYQEAVI